MIGESIVYLREKMGLSQADLARRLKMTRAQLCVIEKGCYQPTGKTLARLAAALEISLNELEAYIKRSSAVSQLQPIRRESRICLSERKRAEATDAELTTLEHARGMLSATTLPLLHAYLGQPHASEVLAASLRDSLRVGMAAFTDLVWTLEFANVRIHVLDFPSGCSSASWWNPVLETLTIAVSRIETPERQLYRIAYEVGAACLFRSSGNKPVAETKKEHRFLAEFAADFLMPAIAIADMVSKSGITPTSWTFSQLLAFKAHFGVSTETFAFRLEELGLIEKSLRHRFREGLRSYYKLHPKDKEPKPYRAALACGMRHAVLRESSGKKKRLPKEPFDRLPGDLNKFYLNL